MTYPVGGHWAAVVTTPGDDLTDVLSVAELQERARIVPGDEESDALLTSYLTAARQQFERDTGLAVPTQTIAVTFAYAPAPSSVLLLPMPPLQAVTAMAALDADGAPVDLDVEDPALVRWLDTGSMPARLVTGPAFPAGLGLALTLTVGWTKQTLPEAIRFAIGVLATHYLTAGRDRVVIGTSVLDMPAGYREVVEAYRLEVVA